MRTMTKRPRRVVSSVAIAGTCLLLMLPTTGAVAQGVGSEGPKTSCAAPGAADTAGAPAVQGRLGRSLDAPASEIGSEELDDPGALISLGTRLLQETRETADYSLLVRAEEAFTRVADIEPDNVEAILGLGSIALSRHEFAAALALGTEALEVNPASARAMGVTVDALIELGRYEEAGDALGTMLKTRPDLSSYARLSYFHELHGRDDLAIEAMEHAVTAAGPVPENTEFARVLLGDLWLRDGDVSRARCLYQGALDRLPDYVPALRGLAEVAAADGDLDGSIALLERAIAHTPLPELVIMLAETQDVAGDPGAAADSYQLVRDIEGLLRSQGVAADPSLAVFEVDHGDPAVALEQAREAYATTPSVRAADALAWSLHANGSLDEAQSMSQEALRLGWQDPTALYHAGAIALSREDFEAASRLLGQSLDRNPGAWYLLQDHALAALERATDGVGA